MVIGNNEINATNRELTLLFHLNSDQFTYCLFNKNTNKFEFIDTIFLNSLNNLESEITNIFNAEDKLAISFEMTKGSICTSTNTFIPSVLFNEKYIAKYIKFNSTLTKENKCLFNKQAFSDFYSVYAIQSSLLKTLNKITSNLTLKHTASIFVDYAISLSQKLKSYIFIQINKNNFHIAYINNSKLLFYNEFKYKSLDDFMYYFLNCLNVLELNHNLIDVKLMSSLESNDPVFTSIKNYLNNTHFINRPNNFNYSHNIHEISEHKYHDIFSQLICV